jgi:hypothetical protein
VKTSGWLRGLQVTGGGTGVVSHAGVALVRGLADNIGLTAGLSEALAGDRVVVHDRGRVLTDLACAIADGAEAVSDFRVVGDQSELFGSVASVPTVWRMLAEVAGGGTKTAGRVTDRSRTGPVYIAGAPRSGTWRPAEVRAAWSPVLFQKLPEGSR